MRGSLYLLAGLLVIPTSGGRKDSDCASVKRTGDQVTLTADSWVPVLAMGRILADQYGINVSIEAPKWAFPEDAEDVAVADPEFSARHGNVHYLLMKSHVLEVRFPVSADGSPDNVPGLIRQIADAANQEMPYAYRVDQRGNDYTLVPTETRESKGKPEDAQPLLDRHVTIPSGSRTIAEHAKLMADQLSEQTGLHVSCCQAFVLGGVPWGMARVEFEANEKPAREVLRSLIELEQQANSKAANRHPSFARWTVSCDGTGAPWCFIEVTGTFTHRCVANFTQAFRSR